MWNIFALLAFNNLQPMNKAVLIPALNFLWKGLLAIFVVIGLIILSVKLTAFFVKKAEESKTAKEQKNADSETPSGN